MGCDPAVVETVTAHYEKCWGVGCSAHQWRQSPALPLATPLTVLCFPPHGNRDMWTYTTAGMSVRSEAGRSYGLELHLVSPDANEGHIELLTAVAHYHLTGEPLGWGHTVNFGRPWYSNSRCSYGLISLPYLDGPELEWLGIPAASTRCLWLVPITREEREFAVGHGIEALEEQFELTNFDYMDPKRPSVA
jgi:hypothetical protein